MYIAAVRIADDFGCDCDRHSISAGAQGSVAGQRPGRRDAQQLATARRCTAATASASCSPASRCRTSTKWTNVRARWAGDLSRPRGAGASRSRHTLHDLRWGDRDHSRAPTDEYVWVFVISGAAPPAHFIGGWAGAKRSPAADVLPAGRRHAARASPSPARSSGRGSMWPNGALHMDIGRGEVVELPREETERRWKATTPQWPIMHARDLRRLARSDDGPPQGQSHPGRLREPAKRLPTTRCWPVPPWRLDLGIRVHFCGTRKDGSVWCESEIRHRPTFARGLKSTAAVDGTSY